MSNMLMSDKNANANANANIEKKYNIVVTTKNFYNSVFKKNAKMLSVMKKSDKKQFHVLDAIVIDKNKMKVFSSVLLKIEDARHITSKNEKEDRKEYYTCSLDNFMKCISSKYNLTETEATSYREQLEACYNK